MSVCGQTVTTRVAAEPENRQVDGVVELGSHLIKGWSSTQTVVALSSGEAEYYSLVRGGSIGLGTRSLLADLRANLGIFLCTDATGQRA